jgi:hypothetical protein
MSRCALILLAFGLASPGFAAETAAERGKRVVDEALKALGGDAFLKMEDRVEFGRAYSFSNSEVSDLSVAKIYTRYISARSAEPGKLRVSEREAFFRSTATAARDEEQSAVLMTPDGGWILTYRGALPFADERFKNYVDATRHNIFYILRCRMNEPWDYYSRGADIIDNRPVEIVEMTDAAGETITVYFGGDDKLPMRQMYRRRNPTFKDFDTEVTNFDKYHDAGGGVMWPFDIRRERNGERTYQIMSDTVQVNQNLPDNLFTIPGSMKILPKPK